MARKQEKHIHPQEGPEKAFGQALREFRAERGVSQEQLALVSGLDRTYISLVERGLQSPTIRNLFRISNSLGLTPSALISRAEALIAGRKRG